VAHFGGRIINDLLPDTAPKTDPAFFADCFALNSPSATANPTCGRLFWPGHRARPRRTGAPRLGFMRPFHLAFPVHDLTAARAFYGELLGCPEGRSSET